MGGRGLTPYYSDATNTLYHGDCADVLPYLEASPDLVITSPPYGLVRTYGGGAKVFDFDRVADAIVRAMGEGSVLVWIVTDTIANSSKTGASFTQALGFMDRGLWLHDTMIWQKNSPGVWTPNRYQQDWEYMFVFSKGAPPKTANMIQDRPIVSSLRPQKTTWDKGRHGDESKIAKPHTVVYKAEALRSSIWYFPTGGGSAAPDFPRAHEHPAIFPIRLIKDHIRTWSNEGDIVLDPMSGSGTVLRAAKDMHRIGVGVEINESYCKLAIDRLAQGVLI